MMKLLKCYDVLAEIINEADERFSPVWKRNFKKQRILQKCCNVIDNFIEQASAETLEIEIDEITMQTVISIECSMIPTNALEILSPLSVFFKRLIVYNANKIIVHYSFPNIWERT